MAIRFLSGQTIDGNLTVSGNVQAATFNTLPIETARNNNANRIVRTNVHGYVDFGWINSTSGNHTGSITRITASNDEYLRYVTPAQFRTNVTDGYYAPASTVSGVTSVATGNGLTGGTITSTGTLTMSGSYSGDFAISGTSGTGGNALSVTRGSDGSSAFRVQNTGEVVVNSNYFYATGPGVSMYVQNTAVFRGSILNDGSNAPVRIADDLTIDGDITVSGGDIVLGGTGRIQGVDTVSAGTDAANKNYVDAHPGSGGTVTSVTAGNGLAGGTITTTGTLSTVHLPSFDTRNSNPDPEDYANLIRFDFKHNSTNGLSDGGSYNGQMTWRSYGSGSDMSGGLPIRLAYTANGNLWRQMGTSATAWGSWKKFAIGTGTTAQYIRGDASLATFPTIPPDPTGVYLPLSGGTMTGSIVMSNNNITSIGNLTLNNGWRLRQGASNYASINSWIYLEGVHGLYTGTNGAHFYPNTGSDYGAWRMTGSRNSWGGITFHGGENTLMVSTATMGFFNDQDNEWMVECQRNSYTRLYYNGIEQARTDNGFFFANNQIRSPIFYDSDNTTYYVNAATGSNLHTPITFQTNDSTLTFQDAGTNAFQMKTSAGDELYLGSNNNYQLQMTTSGNVNTQGQWRFGANFVKVGNSSTYNSDDGSWGSRFVVASTVHARIDCAQDANAVRASWFTHTGQLYSTFGTVTGHDMRLISHNATRQYLYNGYSQEAGSYRAPIFYDSNNTAYYLDPASTSNLNGLTVAGTITGTIASSNKLAITGYQTNGQSFYQTSGSFAGYSGWANYYIGNHGDGSSYYNTTIIFPFWGPPKYSRLEGGTFRGPYNFLNNEVDQTIGVYLQSTTSLRAPIFYDSNNTAFYLDPSTTGTSVNVAGDVVAYASSDIRFKNNVTPITNALDKLSKIGGYTFEWNEISHKETGKKDIGVIAQEVEEILPEIVQTRSNGYKAVDYQKLTALLIESVKEQQFIIDDLKLRIESLEKI